MGSSEKDDDDRRLIGSLPSTANIDRVLSSSIDGYPVDQPIYNDVLFRCRFSIPRVLFKKLRDDLCNALHDRWKTLTNTANRAVIPSSVKVLACLQVLTKGRSIDDVEDLAIMEEKMYCNVVAASRADWYVMQW